MICLECGENKGSINKQHLKRCCGLTLEEYIIKHPDSKTKDDDVRLSYGMKLDTNPNWRGGKTLKYCTDCNKKLNKNNKSGYCRSCSFKGEGNPFYGKNHTNKTKDKMVESNKHREPSTYKVKPLSPEKISINSKKYWETVTEEKKYLHLNNFINAGLLSCKKSSKTKIENTINDILLKNNFFFSRNSQVGIFNVDFLIGERLVIECMGDYWHCNPVIYKSDFYNKSLKLTSKEKWVKDLNRKNKLVEKGYKILYVWEYDIKNNIELIETQILNFIKIN